MPAKIFRGGVPYGGGGAASDSGVQAVRCGDDIYTPVEGTVNLPDFTTINDATASDSSVYSSNKTNVLLGAKADKSETAEYPIADSVSGDAISVSDSADANVQGLTIYGKSRVSKNLISTLENGGISSDGSDQSVPNPTRVRTPSDKKIAVDASKKYTLNGIATLTGYTPSGSIHQYASDDTYIGYIGWVDLPYTFDLSSNCAKVRISLRYADNSNVTVDSFKDVQLELGSTHTSYEPYGIISIGDSGSLDVQTCGKNMLGELEKMGFDSSGNKMLNSSRASSIKMIAVKPGTKYTLNAATNITGKTVQGAAYFYRKDGSYIRSYGWENVPWTFTNLEDSYFVYIAFRLSDDSEIEISNFTSPQFELGSTATAYEPYVSSTASFTTGLPLCGIPVTSGETYTDEQGQKWLADTADVEGVVKRCYKVTLDGSEDWDIQRYGEINCEFFINSLSPTAAQVTSSTVPNIVGKIQSYSANDLYSVDGASGICIIGNYALLRMGTIKTAADLKTYLASNPVTVVYALASPTTQELTTAEKSALLNLKTFDSTTNVTVTDDPFVDISYIKNTANGKAAEQLADNLRASIGWIFAVPEMHRNILRGKYLGSTVTAAQLAAIEDGSFDDLYVGDYWTISTTIGGAAVDVNYRIADMDYLFGTGEYPDHMLDKHHLVIVPDTALDTAVMGSNNYWTSTLRTTNIAAIKTALDAIFPNMILPFYLQPTVTDPTYLQCYVEVMSAYMVYGHQGLYIDDDRSPIDKTQLALFALVPKAITVPDTSYWLNTRLSDTTRMQAVTSSGEMWRGTVASSQYGIRPFFLIGDASNV